MSFHPPLPLSFALLLLALVLLPRTIHAQEIPRDSLQWMVEMHSGDVFRGTPLGSTDSSIAILTEFGTVVVPKKLISRFEPIRERVYGGAPFHFLMPSASPNGPGGFLSNYELGFLYGGFGLGNGATITGGMTLIPGIPLRQQIFHVGAKFTLERSEHYDLAVGAAYTFITTDYPYAHIYGVATFPLGTGRWSAMILYKASGREAAPISTQFFSSTDSVRFTVFYPGSLGAAVGFDAPAFGRDDIRWFAEIWNNDLNSEQNTVTVGGLKIVGDRLSAQFGLALFTAPFIVPVTSFSWRF